MRMFSGWEQWFWVSGFRICWWCHCYWKIDEKNENEVKKNYEFYLMEEYEDYDEHDEQRRVEDEEKEKKLCV